MSVHPDDLVRSDFQEEGKYQWVAHRNGYRVVVRAYNGHGAVEVIVREEIEGDPTPENWQHALNLVNEFYQSLHIAQEEAANLELLRDIPAHPRPLHDQGISSDDSIVDFH